MFGRRRPIPSVTVREASQLADGAMLLDVREAHEWKQGHAPDAVHIPMRSVKPSDVPHDRPIYCICRSGNRSGRVTQMLRRAGVDARNVSGGMQAWLAAGLPVVK